MGQPITYEKKQWSTAIRREIHKEELTSVDELLITKTLDGIPNRYGEVLPEDKIKKIGYELNIIIRMGFSDYLLIVQDFLDIGRRIGHMPDNRIDYLKKHSSEMNIEQMVSYINADQSFPGLTIGPGRGSAAGSAVCYILGITNLDPFEYDLLFERFLNPERVSMPDIDSDLSKSEFEYGVRDIVIEYVTKKYGRNGICGITTPSTLAARGAVKSVARIIGSKKICEMEKKAGGSLSKEHKQEEESIKKQYLKYADEINRDIPAEPNTFFRNQYDETCTLGEHLLIKYKDCPELIEIIEMTIQAEGLNINYGMHACGKIIYPGDIRDSAALMYDTSSGIWKIQMDAEDAEKQGYLKMDFLGLKTLNIITKTVRLVYQMTGQYIDCDRIPFVPEVFSEVFSKGLTQEIFQFGSAGMKGMLRRFQPTSFSDLILLVACYRPGPLQYLPQIIRRKHKKETEEDRNSVLARIPQIHKIIEPTYLSIVYQEQVQQIFQVLAGYSLGQADLVRRAMGHKETETLEKEKQSFLYGDEARGIKGCVANGLDAELATKLFSEMSEFAKYAFNRSHAAAYALVAYITGYLKLKYPTEFYTAVLSFSDISKYPALIQEAKNFHVKVKGPDICKSEASFTGKDKTIYFGFSGIKGIGKSMDHFTEECRSIPDFLITTALSDSTVTTLAKVGAFDALTQRQALLAVLPEYFAQKKIIRDKQKNIDTWNTMIGEIEKGVSLDREKWKITTKNLPTKASLLKRIRNAQAKIDLAKEAILDIKIPTETIFNDTRKNLQEEKELLGMYASGHPTDAYERPLKEEYAAIAEVDEGSKAIFGMISGMRIFLTKKTQEPMSAFKLEDASGSISVCCFPKSFRANQVDDLKDGDVISIQGNAKLDERDGEETFQFFSGQKPGSIKKVSLKKKRGYISISGIEEWPVIKERLRSYITPNPESGHIITIFNRTTGELEVPCYHFLESVWNDPQLEIHAY